MKKKIKSGVTFFEICLTLVALEALAVPGTQRNSFFKLCLALQALVKMHSKYNFELFYL